MFVWRKGLEENLVKTALVIFAVQLVLNVLWSAAFFGLRSPLAGLIEIFFLRVSIAVTIMNFNKVSRTAALLLIPYILWVSFAGVLNFLIWRLS